MTPAAPTTGPPEARPRLSPLRPALRASLRDDSRATPYIRLTETLLRGPVEVKQYTSIDFTQELTDHGVLASVGSVGDAYDNAMAESFVDSLKTELIADRVWRSRSQLELGLVEYISWFNSDRLHESLGDIPPAEFEALHADRSPPGFARPPGSLRRAAANPTTLIDER